MSKLKKLTIIASVLLVISIIGGAMTYQLSYGKALSTDNIPLSQQDFANIQLKSHDSAINIRQTNQDTAYLELTGINTDRNFTYAIRENTLFINNEDKQKRWFSLGIRKEKSIQLYLPQKQFDTITIDKGDGYFLAEDIMMKQLAVKGKDGVITLKNTEAELHTIETLDGVLQFEHIKGALKTTATDGKVKLIANQLQYPVDIAMKDGIITVDTNIEPVDTTIQVQYKDGIVSLYGKKTTHAQFGNGENKVNLSIKDGMITVK